ncbi:MAG: type II toxin-antitoxin system HicB family antitoxin [Elusimicrobia bacterium]|nr:type II toxin-antitoxin system HicB family antitoxin [Elusimicrobiota bacterium]
MGLSGYIGIAMKKAHYKVLDNGNYFGEIPGLNGVWAENKTLENCRQELQEVLEDWIVLKLRDQEKLPAISGHTLKISTAVHA